MIRIWKALLNSLAGLLDAIHSERAFRQELILVFILTPLIFILDISLWLKILVAASQLIVLIIELLNSALEAIIDLVSPQYHELARRAKNYGSAAVALSFVICLILWGLAMREIFIN